MGPLRIALNHTRLAAGGGVEGYILNLLRHLLDAGHSVDYFCGKVSLEMAHPRLRIVRVPYLRAPRLLRVASFALLSHRAIAREERAKPYDVVQGFSRTYYHTLYRDGSGCRQDYRELYLDPVNRRGLRRLYYKLDPIDAVVRRIERRRFVTMPQKVVIANSRFVRDQILRRYAVAPESVRIIYSGVDCDRFRPDLRGAGRAKLDGIFGEPGGGTGRRYLTFVGNDYERKGLDLIFQALLRFVEPPAGCPDFRLVVAGADPRTARYERAAREMGLSSRAAFLGRRSDVPEILAGSDALLLPSYFDAYANVGNEALACGTPVIVSPTTGNAELIGADNGWVLAKNDAEELRRALEGFFAVQDLSSHREGARRAALELSWGNHYRKIDEVLEEFAAKREESDGAAG